MATYIQQNATMNPFLHDENDDPFQDVSYALPPRMQSSRAGVFGSKKRTREQHDQHDYRSIKRPASLASEPSSGHAVASAFTFAGFAAPALPRQPTSASVSSVPTSAMPSSPTASAAPQQHAGGTDWPDRLLRLHCHPFDQLTSQRVLAHGHNPVLHLNCRPERSIMSVLHHLENKWGPIVGEQGMPSGITIVPPTTNDTAVAAFHLDDGDEAEMTKVGHLLDPTHPCTTLQLWYSFLPMSMLGMLDSSTSAGARRRQDAAAGRHATALSRMSSVTTADAPPQPVGAPAAARGAGPCSTPSVHSNGSNVHAHNNPGGSQAGQQQAVLATNAALPTDQHHMQHQRADASPSNSLPLLPLQGDGAVDGAVDGHNSVQCSVQLDQQQQQQPMASSLGEAPVGGDARSTINTSPAVPVDAEQPTKPQDTTNMTTVAPPRAHDPKVQDPHMGNPTKPACSNSTGRQVTHSQANKDWMAAAGFGASLQQRASQASAAQHRTRTGGAKTSTHATSTTTHAAATASAPQRCKAPAEIAATAAAAVPTTKGDAVPNSKVAVKRKASTTEQPMVVVADGAVAQPEVVNGMVNGMVNGVLGDGRVDAAAAGVPPSAQHEVEALLAHIHLPLDSATVRLGMSKGKIKTLMTRLGIRRWPSKWVVKCVNALLQQHAAGRSVHAGNFRDVALFDRYKDCPDQFAMGKEQSKQTKRRKARAAADADDATQRVALQPVVLQPQYMPPGIMYTQPHGGQPGAHMVAPPPPPPGHMMSQEHMLPPQCVPMAPPAVPDHSAPPQHAMVYVPHQRPPAQSVMDMSDVDNIDWLLDGLDNLADDIPMANNGTFAEEHTLHGWADAGPPAWMLGGNDFDGGALP